MFDYPQDAHNLTWGLRDRLAAANVFKERLVVLFQAVPIDGRTLLLECVNDLR